MEALILKTDFEAAGNALASCTSDQYAIAIEGEDYIHCTVTDTTAFVQAVQQFDSDNYSYSAAIPLPRKALKHNHN